MDPATTVSALVRRGAQESPGQPAILAPGRAACTYEGLAHQVAAVGAALRAAGIAREDRVAVALPTGPEMATAFVGVASVATCAPLNTAYTTDEATFYLRDLSARALIVRYGEDLAAREAARALGVPCLDVEVTPESPAGIFGLRGLREVSTIEQPAAAPEDVALVLHTSGTTSRPKQVPLSHANVCASAGSVAATLGLTAADRCLNVMPLFHIHGLVASLVASLTVSGSVICTSGFDGSRFLGWLHEWAATWYTAVPTVHQAVLSAAGADPGAASRARLRFIRSSSAPLPPQVMAELEDRFGAPVIEAYGMTEAAHQMTSNPLPPGERRAGTVGLAAGPEVAIMDAAGRLLGSGHTGEVVIRGPNVTTGYLANEETNAEAFRDGWFRTGDQGVFDADGYLTITGRLKELINRGGEKVAPREVDEALLAHPSVARALAFAVPHPSLGEDVAAAVVPVSGTDLDPGDLRRFVAEHIAAYKVPRRIVVVDELPTGPTGKPTRIGLAERLGLTASAAVSPPREPTSPLEAALAALWGQLLGLEEVPVDGDFVALGGDSLSALELLAQVRDAFGVELPLGGLFDEAATVRSMAALVTRMRAQGARAQPVVVESSDGKGTLSYLQERLWFLDVLEEGLAAYNAPMALRLRGPMDREALGAALDVLVSRHEILRTAFPTGEGGRPRAVVQPPAHVPLPFERIDGAAADPEVCLARARARVQRELETLFDLAAGPPLRALVVQMGPEDHVFVLVCHHMTTDGWSRRLMRRELAILYGAFARGDDPALPPVTLRYGDLAAQQRLRLADPQVAGELLGWWRAYLSDLPGPLELPLDRRRPPRQDHSGATLHARLPAEVWGAVDELARGTGATPFMVLLAGFFALLRRYTGREDLTTGVSVLLRTAPGAQDVVGPFADTVVVRSHLEGDPRFSELLGEVRAACVGAYEHAVPFELVVDALAPERDPAHPPLFQVMFGLRNYPDPPDVGSHLGMEEMSLDAPGAKLELELDLQPTPDGGVDLTVVYAARLFDPATIERMTRHYAAVLAGAIAAPETRVSQLDLLAFDERSRQATLRAGPPAIQAEARSLHELVAAQAATRPDAVAVRCGDVDLTYAELVRRAGCLAAALAVAGVEAGDLVAVLAGRSEQLVVALLGVLWRGATYVPLDPALPQARLDSMVARARPSALVGDDASVHAADLGLPVVTLAPPPREAPTMDPTPVAPDDLAYVIFTSGSTGTPKGVMIEHRSILNLLASVALRPGFRAEQVLLAVTTPTFDASLFELFLPLVCGGTVVVANEETARDPWLLGRAIGRGRIDLMAGVPSLWRMLLDSGWEGDPALVAVSTGEELTAELARALLPKVRELWNLYGPTETTIWSALHQVGPNDDPVPLGSPVSATVLTVRDPYLRPVPLGVPGELLIGGKGLARGYLGEPDLTAERFVEDPEGEGRLYLTGDLVRQRANGTLEYLGRIDHQVKLRGYRIEPGEVENALITHPEVTRAVVMLHGEGKDASLVAYVQAIGAPDASELRRHLGEQLPAYMMPGSFVVLPALPLTSSGKVDRGRLPSPASSEQRSSPRPSTPTERELGELWRHLLALDGPPGPDDAFFDLGGHSLLAVELFVQIQRRFGVDLPLAQIFDTPTLASLAAAVDDVRRPHRRSAPRSPVLLTEGPVDGPTVFWVPGILGTTVELRRLAAEVAGGATLYGLEAPGNRSRERPVRTVEHLARVHMASLESFGLHRPFVVGGNSFGGLVAYELATMLDDNGARPDRLVIVDSWGPLEHERRSCLNWKGRAIDTVLPRVHRLVRDRRLRPNAADRLDWVVRASRTAAGRYEPGRRYHGYATFVVTEHRARLCGDPLLGWSEHLRGGVDRVMVDGGHDMVLADERVVLIARLCSQQLPTSNASFGAVRGGTRPAIS